MGLLDFSDLEDGLRASLNSGNVEAIRFLRDEIQSGFREKAYAYTHYLLFRADMALQHG